MFSMGCTVAGAHARKLAFCLEQSCHVCHSMCKRRREGRILGFISTRFAVSATRSESRRLIQLALTAILSKSATRIGLCIPFEGRLIPH